MAIFLSLFFGFIPAFINACWVYWLDRYEKEPKTLLGGAFLWGAIVASGAAFIFNSIIGGGVYLFTKSESTADLTTGSIIAPIMEETLKGTAVLMVYLFVRSEFDSILDGIVYAAITALGFAATENFYYIYHLGFETNGLAGLFSLAFVRVILVGWQHPFYTAFIGIGLAAARMSRTPKRKVTLIGLGWLLAILTHSLHNTLAHFMRGFDDLLTTSLVDWSGWLVMFIFILWTIRREKKLLVQFLYEEVGFGILTPQQYATACSPSHRWRARMAGLQHGRYRLTTRFYQLCGEIAHKKNQFTMLGDEQQNQASIGALREELRQLSPWVFA